MTTAQTKTVIKARMTVKMKQNSIFIKVTDNSGSQLSVMVPAGFCSCPVGGKGKCKHVVALLLTYLKQQGKTVGV
jgi:predicted nucleic acid-binding Zn finger protein